MADKEVGVLPEKIGLPADATPEQILGRVYEMQEQLNKDGEMKAMVERLLKRAKEGDKAKADRDELEAKFYIDSAVRQQRIDKGEETFYLDMYKKHPDEVKKHIEERAWRRVLSEEKNLRVDENDYDPRVEVEGRAAELMAKDKTLKKGEAMLQVLGSDKELNARYEAKVTNRLTPGGDH